MEKPGIEIVIHAVEEDFYHHQFMDQIIYFCKTWLRTISNLK